MPSYDFKCQSCGKVVDRYFHITKVPKELECECGGKAVQQLTTGAKVQYEDVHKFKAEHNATMRKAKRARQLKASGEIPMDHRIDIEDPRIAD